MSGGASDWRVTPGGPLRGRLRVPGDKSISHRALLFNGLARGRAKVRGLLDGEDVRATAAALRAMGVRIEAEADAVIVEAPAGGLREPSNVLDCGNSGTSIRLLAGVVASRPMFAVLTGDDSLRGRPMKRVADPLRRMGAGVWGRDGDRLPPIAVRGGDLRPCEHDLSVASAQVKTCLLLAGLGCGVAVREPSQSRDHSERLLARMGAKLSRDADGWIRLQADNQLEAVDVEVPGDLSAAAFWLVAASVVPGSEVVLENVGVNPTRAGVLDALRAMGADITREREREVAGEPVADLRVRHAALRGARIDGELALRALDELPVLSVAASFATGETTIADAEELRVKESDRIARVATGLRALGVAVEERPDGMVVQGGAPAGPAEVDGSGDHRITMAFAVAGLVAPGGVLVRGADSITSSYPAFPRHLEALRA